MKSLNRRQFIKSTATVGAGAMVLPRFSIGQAGPSANSKLNIAVIGAGGVASQVYGPGIKENIVAMCDVDEYNFGAHLKKFPDLIKAARFKDFRVMLDKMGDQIDAVAISTPDHTHFVATMDAMQRGKHVFTQKPLTHNIWQARTLQKAKHKYKVVTQMGNQGHTYDGIRQMREWYEAGVLGQVKEVHAWHPGPGWDSKYFQHPAQHPPASEAVPDHLDWDLWLGPVVTDRPYNHVYHPFTWRGFYDFSSGILGDWFPHICDGPHWILDLNDPVTVEAVERPHDTPAGFVEKYSVIKWTFPKRGKKAPCSLTWYTGGKKPELPPDWTWGNKDEETGKYKHPGPGSFWYGTKKNAYLDNRSNNPRLANREEAREFKEAGYPEEKYPRIEGGPVAEWIRACKDESPEPSSNFDVACPFTEMNLIGVLAIRHGGKIEWDPKKGVVNRPELNAYIKEPVRKGWEYGDDLWG
jgi:predicted dehydrogenase